MKPSTDQPGRRQWLEAGETALLWGLLYFAATSLNRYIFTDGWTILWPLNGVTIALLLMRPRAKWPTLLFGIALGTGLAELHDNPLGSAIWQRAISLAEVLISASLLPAFSSLTLWLRQPYIFRRFVASLLLGPGLSGIAAAILFHHLQRTPYLAGFNSWATADALGIAAIMPLALSIRSPELRCLFSGAAMPRTLGTLTFALAAATLALSVSRYPLLFLVYPILLLVDMLLSFAGAALATCAVCLLAVYLAIHHHGPFGLWPRSLLVSRDVALQLFLGFHVVALFPASVRILERRRIGEELRDANVQLTMLASLDGLTGIANRRALDERFAKEWNRALRMPAPLSLLMIDIDHFKQFNDRYGHPAGDQALISVATALATQMRRPDDLAARFGGEEFAALLPNTELLGAAHLAEQLRQSVADLAIPHQGSPWGRITISVGCAAHQPFPPINSADRFALLHAADQALYQAKVAGRNRVETGCGEHDAQEHELVL